MKNLFSILLILPFLSCSIDSENSLKPELLGDWVLVQTSGQIINSIQTGADMPFQENYSLKSDSTFIKTRNTDGEIMTVSGTFEVKPKGETSGSDLQFYVLFHHQVNSPLLSTCFSSFLTEHLFLTTRGRLISSYNQCDGPGLEYEKNIDN